MALQAASALRKRPGRTPGGARGARGLVAVGDAARGLLPPVVAVQAQALDRLAPRVEVRNLRRRRMSDGGRCGSCTSWGGAHLLAELHAADHVRDARVDVERGVAPGLRLVRALGVDARVVQVGAAGSDARRAEEQKAREPHHLRRAHTQGATRGREGGWVESCGWRWTRGEGGEAGRWVESYS